MTAAETGADTQAPAGAFHADLTPRARLKAILGGAAGNLVEWYDWFAYSSFALYFAPHFFPKGDQTTQLLQAAAVFAVGFLARPAGAWIMGLYADRAGRKKALTIAVAMMCAGSLVIALTPDFAAIGPAAAVLLLLARLLQGLSVGGEYGASATYMSEMATPGRRGFWSSFQFVTMLLGQLIALAVLILLQNLMPPDALEAWGWRIPFVIGALLAVVVFWIRSGLEESAAFLAAQARGESRARTMLLFTGFPRETLMIFGLTAAGSLAFYSYTTYMQKFLVNTTGFAKDTATAITAAALVVYMLCLPLFGWLSDHIGRNRTLALGFGLGALATYPVMSAIAGADSPFAAFALMSLLLVVLCGYSSVSAIVKAELFPAHVRALGVAMPYALANALFGGTAEYLALWFKQQGQESGYFVYVSVMMAGAFLIAMRLRNTNRHSLIVED
jgi:MFS transporter, MHS family, alpha-ketoglutarate permease